LLLGILKLLHELRVRRGVRIVELLHDGAGSQRRASGSLDAGRADAGSFEVAAA
jgi:hypothetical protein